MAAPFIINEVEKTGGSINRSNVVKNIYHPFRNKLYVPTSAGIYLIPVENVLRIESDSNYCWVILKNNEKHLVSRTLKQVHNNLPKHIFIRIHNSHVVNADEIIMIEKNEIILTGKINVPIGRKYKPAFNDLLKKIKY
jgi:two-component system LytT family response regulator